MSEERPTGRPAPQYGEYAPEGWKAPHSEPHSETDGGGASAPPPGVPHNLGVGTSPETAAPEVPASASVNNVPTSPTNQTSAPTKGGAPTAPYTPQPTSTPPVAPVREANGRTPSVADRIITIVLLVLGAFGAMQSAMSMLTLGSQMELMSDVLAGDAITVPDMTVLQAVGALLMLSVYAIVLLWSIHRMRAKKISFWVPLVGGVVALLVTVVLTTIAVMMVPDLLNYSDPENFNKLFEELTRP